MEVKELRVLANKIFMDISPLLEGLNHGQAFFILDQVRNKVDESIYFISGSLPAPQRDQEP